MPSDRFSIHPPLLALCLLSFSCSERDIDQDVSAPSEPTATVSAAPTTEAISTTIQQSPAVNEAESPIPSEAAAKSVSYPLEVEILRSMEIPEAQAVEQVMNLMDIAAYNGNNGVLYTGFSNQEVTQQLLGNNSAQRAFIDKNHPRINDNGELVDKWQTPYEFHFLSARRVEVISAGPDRVPHTEDDLKY